MGSSAWPGTTQVRSKPTGLETNLAKVWLHRLCLYWADRTAFWLCLSLLRTSARLTAMMSSVAKTRA